MKVSRRGLLGLFGGAAAAGPKLAKGIAEAGIAKAATGSRGSGSLKPASWQSEWRSVSSEELRESRIKELEKFLLGKGRDSMRRRAMDRMRHLDDLERLRLDSLRSVSPGQKMRILIDGMADRDERARIAGAEFELADLLNPLKGI